MPLHDDVYYITRILQGNPNDFAVLVDKYKRMAYTLALKLVQVPEDAEEVAQDAFVKAYRALGSFKGDSKFSTWLYKILYHTALSRLRKKQPEVIPLEQNPFQDPELAESSSIVTRLTREEQTLLLHTAINQLPPEDKALITLYYMNESTVKEIAFITGESESNIKIRLFRTRKKLREMLKHAFSDKTIVSYEEY